MSAKDWTQFQYQGSPFFVTVDPVRVNEVIGQMNKRRPSDYALADVLGKVASEHLVTRLMSFTTMSELEERHETTPHDLQNWFTGFVAPLTLIKASFLWISSGEDNAKAFVSSLPGRTEQDMSFKTYLLQSLPLCARMLREVKDARIIFEHTRQRPFLSDVYYRVGVEAAFDAINLYAISVNSQDIVRYGVVTTSFAL